MQNRWYSKEGVAKKVSSLWRDGGRQEYAALHREKFQAHRIQWFIKDSQFAFAHKTTNREEQLCCLVAFIGLYNNGVVCDRKLFTRERYHRGALILIGMDDMDGGR